MSTEEEEYTDFRASLLYKNESLDAHMRATLTKRMPKHGKILVKDVKMIQKILLGLASDVGILLNSEPDFSGGDCDEHQSTGDDSGSDSDEDEEEASSDEDEDEDENGGSGRLAQRQNGGEVVPKQAPASSALKDAFPINVHKLRFKRLTKNEEKARYIGYAFVETVFCRILMLLFKQRPSHCLVLSAIMLRWGTNAHEKAVIVEMGRYLSRHITADGTYIRDSLKALVNVHIFPDDKDVISALMTKLAAGNAEEYIERYFSVLCFLDNASAFLSTVHWMLKTGSNSFASGPADRFRWVAKGQYPEFALPPQFQPVEVTELTMFETPDARICYKLTTAGDSKEIFYEPSTAAPDRTNPADLTDGIMSLFPVFAQLTKTGQDLSSLKEKSTISKADISKADGLGASPTGDGGAGDGGAGDGSPKSNDYEIDF